MSDPPPRQRHCLCPRPLVYPGVYSLEQARTLPRCMISVNRLLRRVGAFDVNDWIIDSGAFTRLASGKGHLPTAGYARQIERFMHIGNLQAVVAQDYMCEPAMLERRGRTIAQNQADSTRRYLALRSVLPEGLCVMPVLQGWEPRDYLRHARALSPALPPGAWVGVGSVCQRQGDAAHVAAIVDAILSTRSDLRLHGFGVKTQALVHPSVRAGFASVDSMAWSFAARRRNRNGAAGPNHNSLQALTLWLDRTTELLDRYCSCAPAHP